MEVHDLIGVGFGPSNLALAIALQEHGSRGEPVRMLFLEREPRFAWHEHMMLADTRMQVAFLKDLVSLRNPRSHFSFVNYLHEQNRLQDFINLKTFYPSRHEFGDYLAWAAGHFSDCVEYGNEVLEVTPHLGQEGVHLLKVHTRDRQGQDHYHLTRHLVIGIGGSSRIPDQFVQLRHDKRIFHSSGYLKSIPEHMHAQRVAVIGAGQSAAEIFMDLPNQSANVQVDLIMRNSALRVADDSPFVNEIFNADLIDQLYDSPEQNAAYIKDFWHTNYAAADLALVENIYQVIYQQKVRGLNGHRILNNQEITAVQSCAEGVSITLKDRCRDACTTHTYDAVILATGYRRDHHLALLKPLASYLGDFRVDRQYRLHTTPDFRPSIFLQGACESSHGLSDTLLSVLATRSAQITAALTASLSACEQGQLR
ncbi:MULTISPECIES: lysine N(6)-hydroxylase/L-ornithine N(5)-oxygenase family protein [Pseudomonadota]|jgi:lysine/ornithine N-monooxygenase|uniref:lysine N(6)-hydroxylase/L-ornithine N(5)-oxygenase family protein n=1 Tax=Pseudomonadota TaxID=1224 RepID=UPI0008B0916E|nr:MULTISPECIES: lysine N(6)-hydroxylase/L-ornithine N(5)-oxygenase family protein [Pseudomonadota]MDO9418511.1 lysine N(6)-hydroxylase/L-ornithine N(5)-oxygenase family protein [Pararhizobium sp.]SEU11152.1 L-ornithine N5-oxygenase [Pseudomonas sp. NFR09]